MLSYFSLIATLACSQPPISSRSDLNIGESLSIYSEILQEDRVLNMYYPHDFDCEKTYPVIYLLDGSIDEDFLHITGLVQFFHLQFQMPDFIIVGIANVDRKRDFTFPTAVEDLKKKYPSTGHSEAFISFLETELIPFINAQYSTNKTKYLIGQSLGGLLATEILLKKPMLFSHYLIVSPSLWWDEESLVDKAPELLPEHRELPEFVYISVGAKEAKIMQKEAKKIYKYLRAAPNKPQKLEFNRMKKENHASILHRSIYEAFLRLFP